ncbi:MAG: hypothetical protein KDI75_10370 [Xanthomonadales bacterium]|nr:hypothetical protein [Xanthomonadales bacterium]
MRSLFSTAMAMLVAAAAVSPVHAADALVGEWALDASQCATTRIVYTADGRNEAWLNDGGWSKLSSGSYTHNGAELAVEANGQRDQLHIVRLDNNVLELRNADKARMDQIGRETVSFVRCPSR